MADPSPREGATRSGPPVPAEGTRLESVEEIREALKARRTPTLKEATDADTVPFRPQRRPPMGLVCVLDDGREEGEWVRLRQDTTVIGRSEGDLIIPHDSMLSSRHAEITRKIENGRCTWYLTDLKSTNGTYVRIGSSLLKHNQEFILGSRRYRFDAAVVAAPANEDVTVKQRETRGWENFDPSQFLPALVELTHSGEGRRFTLKNSDNWIGRDPRVCSIVLDHDPLVSPRHALLQRDKKGRWHLENARSLNGVWVRVDHIALDTACQFQLGEQRFLLKILTS